MLPHKISDVGPEHIRALITNGIAESRVIEFKRDAPKKSDSDKKEFLADVSAFANSFGGDLIFGVDETDGVASSCPGVADFDTEGDSLALESLIRDAISPRMPVEMKVVHGFEKGPVLIIRVGHSWLSPHMVTFKNSSKFFARSSGGKYQMDVTDLRNSFNLMGYAKERIEGWIQERLDFIQSGESPLGESDGFIVAVHVIPLQCFDESTRLQPERFPRAGEAHKRMQPPTGNSWGQHFNIDGYALVSSSGVPSYTQLFRSGKIEKVIVHPGGQCVQRVECELDGHSFDKETIRIAWDGIQALIELGFSMPMLVSLSVCNAEKVSLYHSASSVHECERAFGISQVLAPAILLEEMPSSLPNSLKPALDVVWNASGLPSSMSFKKDGEFGLPLSSDIPIGN